MLARLHNRTMSLSGQRRATLAVLLGALSALALPPWYLVPLVMPAFVGLLWLLDAAAARSRPLSAAAVTAWLFGVGHFFVGTHWIAEPFLVDTARHGWLVPFAVAGFACGLALFPALASLVTAILAYRFALVGVARALVFAVVWVFLEWMRSWLFTGFPWNLIGYVWASTPAFMQFAAIAGIFGVSLITVVAAAMPASLAGPGREPGAQPWIAVAIFTILLPAAVWAGGAMRLNDAPPYSPDGSEGMVPGVRLRIVQANIPQHQKWQSELQAGNLRRHIAMSRQTSSQPPTHVIWPETAVPFFLSNDKSADSD